VFESVKNFWERVQFCWTVLKQDDEEVLFIDVLYTKGVEAYAFDGEKNAELYLSSKHYRQGWNDLEAYQNKIKPVGKDATLQFLKEYVTGVASAYIHGQLFYVKEIAQDILSGKSSEILDHVRRSDGKLYAKNFGDITSHMRAGFDNAMAVMNKQQKLMKTDERVRRIKDVHTGARNTNSNSNKEYKHFEGKRLAERQEA